MLDNDDNADFWSLASNGTDINEGDFADTTTNPSQASSSETWYASTPSGPESADITISTAALGTSCTFQASAEVFGATS